MIAIVKYNAGNATSVKHCLTRLGFESVTTDEEAVLRSADKVIFPGVGEAGSAMRYLKEKGLDTFIPQLTQPVLGICLGMQLMCQHSEEGDTTALGIFEHEVKHFPSGEPVPHMGWNNLTELKDPLFKDITPDQDFYFVHSYYASADSNTAAVCEYMLPFSAALQKDNFYGVQFHPEKSGKAGEQLLHNFLNL